MSITKKYLGNTIAGNTTPMTTPSPRKLINKITLDICLVEEGTHIFDVRTREVSL